MRDIYIITGANGFLGNNIARKLSAQPHCEVRALVSSLDHTTALKDLDCHIYVGDVTKPDTLQQIFRVPESAKVYVIHCAALVYIGSKPNPSVYQVNVLGTKNVINQTLDIGAKLIYISSVDALQVRTDAAITEPIKFNPAEVEGEYAKSKSEASRYVLEAVQNRGLDACVICPSAIIGPHDYGHSHLTELILQVITGRLRAGAKGGYDFVDVRDVVDGIISACAKGKPGECYILSGHFITIPDLFKMISDASGQKPVRIFFPIWLAKFGAPFVEVYYNFTKQTPLFTKCSVRTILPNINFSHAKADRELGYRSRDPKETISDTITWLQDNRLGESHGI